MSVVDSGLFSQPDELQFAIPGLEGRFLEFLGLLNCPYQACQREGLPAKRVHISFLNYDKHISK